MLKHSFCKLLFGDPFLECKEFFCLSLYLFDLGEDRPFELHAFPANRQPDLDCHDGERVVDVKHLDELAIAPRFHVPQLLQGEILDVISHAHKDGSRNIRIEVSVEGVEIGVVVVVHFPIYFFLVAFSFGFVFNFN